MTDRDPAAEADLYASAFEPARDDQGRFAAQPPAPPQTDDPQRTVPTAQERPTPNLGQLPDQGQAAAQAGEGGEQGGQPGADPQQQFSDRERGLYGDLRGTRDRLRKSEADLAARDREMAEMRGQIAAMQQMFQRMGQSPPQGQPQPPAQAPDPFEDPHGFAAHQAEQVLRQRLGPILQQQNEQRQQFERAMTGMQRSVAAQIHGADALHEAEEAFNTAAARREIDPYEHARIQRSDNPFAAAVEWHQRQQTIGRVGTDPNKWFSTEFERRMREDPDFQQQAFGLLSGQARQVHQGQQPPAAGQPAAGRPAPVFTGLPSVNGSPGASARGAPPMDETQLFLSAGTRMGGRA